MPRKPRQQPSGGKRLADSGKKPMLLGWTPEQWELISRAAKRYGLARTQYVMMHALKAAEKDAG